MGYHLGLRSFCLSDDGSYRYYQDFKTLAEPIINNYADQIHQRIAGIYDDTAKTLWDDALDGMYSCHLPEVFYRLTYLMFCNTTLPQTWWTKLPRSGPERRWFDTIRERTCHKVYRENSHPVNRAIVRTRKILSAARKADESLYMGKTHTRNNSAELWQQCALDPCQNIMGVVVDMGHIYASMAHVHQANIRPNAFVVQIYESIDRANFLPF